MNFLNVHELLRIQTVRSVRSHSENTETDHTCMHGLLYRQHWAHVCVCDANNLCTSIRINKRSFTIR